MISISELWVLYKLQYSNDILKKSSTVDLDDICIRSSYQFRSGIQGQIGYKNYMKMFKLILFNLE